MHFKDFCRSLDLLAESVIVARARHLDCPFKPDCAMDASFYNASKIDTWVHDAIDVDNLVCWLKFFDSWNIFLLKVKEENSVAYIHLQKVFVWAQLRIAELILAGKCVDPHQRIEVTDIYHVVSCLTSLQLLERHFA